MTAPAVPVSFTPRCRSIFAAPGSRITFPRRIHAPDMPAASWTEIGERLSRRRNPSGITVFLPFTCTPHCNSAASCFSPAMSSPLTMPPATMFTISSVMDSSRRRRPFTIRKQVCAS